MTTSVDSDIKPQATWGVSVEGQEMRYRPTTAADIPAILAILDAPQNLDKLGAYDEASLRAALVRPDHLLRCVDRQSAFGGFIWLTGLQDISHGPKIEEFGAAIPGQGVGTRLMSFARKELRELGHNRWWLAVAADNTSAIRLYRKLGFVEEETRPAVWHRRKGPVADALIMASEP